jgi:hypothetical protein
MPLDDLVGVIETLQERIRDHSPSLRENETRTRMALIDPLLQVLGWDTADPAMVTPEFNVSGRWADYALLGPGDKPVATVEAKKLGEPLGQHRMQMLNYSNASGVEYAGLTDGDHWEVYEVFQRGQLEDRRILDVSIATAPAHECALQLLLLWRPNLASGQPVLAKQPMVQISPVPFSPAMSEASVGLADVVAPPIAVERAADLAEWSALPDFNPPGGSDPPQSIQFPDGTEHEIRRWNDILVSVATWLNATGRLTSGNVPVNSSAKIYIVHSEPLHPTGNQFFQHRPVADGQLVVNTHGSAVQMRNNSRTLLIHCGVDPAGVLLKSR